MKWDIPSKNRISLAKAEKTKKKYNSGSIRSDDEHLIFLHPQKILMNHHIGDQIFHLEHAL